MRARSRELLLLLVVCALAHSETTNNTAASSTFEDYETADDQEVLFNENRPCPRDCICNVSQGYRVARCNRLEIGTQKFGEDIADLVIENIDPENPIELSELIFKKLGLHQVATIKIVNSTISYIDPRAFHGLSELYALNLSNNKLKSLHPETFANNKKLVLLTLANNPLKFPLPGSDEYFLNASTVQELDISYCNLQHISINMFNNMSGLMYLNVAGNNLSSMEPDTFKKLPDLEELDLSDNNIQSLPDDIFSENTELATLHIAKNPIDTVYGLQTPDLLTLNAGLSNIKFVGPSMFNGMIYIANLNLSGNGIKKIHNQAFHKLVELNYLDLSYNDLDMTSELLIQNNIELDIFKISNNPKLKHLPKDGFECVVDQFNIYLFDASNCGLEEIYDNSLQTFTALSVINLSNNKIKTISSKVFSMSPKLVEINLSNNLLTTLDAKVFEKNNELGKLYLQGNPLKTISADVFIHTPVITWLDMSHAELTSLWKTDKNQPTTLLSNLTYLNISNNHITEIKQSQINNLNKLRTLDISNNPLACSRDFENLMTWLSNRKVSPSARNMNIANMARDAKEEEETYSWEFLSRKTCGTPISHPVEPLNTASDEEIWERIDKDDVGNFDLKNTLDDGFSSKNVDNKFAMYEDNDDIDRNVADDDQVTDDDGDDDDEDDSSEEYDDGEDDVDVKVKLIEKDSKSVTDKKVMTSEAPQTEKININVQLMENNRDEDEYYAYSEATRMDNDHGRYDYVWPILIAILGTILLLIVTAKLVMVMCSKRSKQIRYNSAIIAAMSNPGRTKKDCGLVYQQLSEDLTGPATPKLNRYTPLHSVTVNASNMYESSPFHHSNIVPEAV